MKNNIDTITLLKQLSCETKLIIIKLILENKTGITVSRIKECSIINRTNISERINEMKNVSLVHVKKIGRNNLYTLCNILSKEQKNIVIYAVKAYKINKEKNESNN